MTFTNATGRTLLNSYLYKGMTCALQSSSRVDAAFKVEGSLQKHLMKFKSDALSAQLKAAIDKYKPV